MKREPTEKGHRFLHDLKWIAILWCAGVGGALLLTLPFHLLVTAMMHK